MSKEFLARKRVTEQEFTASWNASRYAYGLAGYRNGGPEMSDNADNWWLAREYLRIQYGVYQTTEAIDTINNSFAGQYALHVSLEDPALVAYTPSREHGVQDRQVKTTFGRFLHKMFPLLTDHAVSSIEARHRAELSGVFEVAYSREDIRHVYVTMAGDTGCMRHDHWAIHPSAIYEFPGCGVAYINREDGQVSARSVIYVNPNDPSDKRYVRGYGDGLLIKLLERKGYVERALDGLKLPLIRSESGGCVMPYLDGPGGNQADEKACYVMRTEEDKLDVVGYEMLAKMSALGKSSYVVKCRSTAGAVPMPTLLVPELFVSDLTGLTHDANMISKMAYYDGGIKYATRDELWGGEYTSRLNAIIDNERIMVFAKPTEPDFYARGNRVVDTEASRVYYGYRKLDPEYYPSDPDKIRWAQDTEVVDGRVVLSVDVANLYTAGGSTLSAYKPDPKALRKQGYVKCHGGGYIHKDSIYYAKSDTGTVFNLDIDETFALLEDGTWANYRHVRDVQGFTRNVKMLKSKYSVKQAVELTVPGYFDDAAMEGYMEEHTVSAKRILGGMMGSEKFKLRNGYWVGTSCPEPQSAEDWLADIDKLDAALSLYSAGGNWALGSPEEELVSSLTYIIVSVIAEYATLARMVVTEALAAQEREKARKAALNALTAEAQQAIDNATAAIDEATQVLSASEVATTVEADAHEALMSEMTSELLAESMSAPLTGEAATAIEALTNSLLTGATSAQTTAATAGASEPLDSLTEATAYAYSVMSGAPTTGISAFLQSGLFPPIITLDTN